MLSVCAIAESVNASPPSEAALIFSNAFSFEFFVNYACEALESGTVSSEVDVDHSPSDFDEHQSHDRNVC